MENNTEIPLSKLKKNDKAIVTKINGGCRMCSRLVSLGILPGVELEVCSANNFGYIIIKVMGCSLGIGRGMTSKIMVKLVK